MTDALIVLMFVSIAMLLLGALAGILRLLEHLSPRLSRFLDRTVGTEEGRWE